MTASLSISLSGLNAASTRLEVSANNLANESSTGTNGNGQTSSYTPQRVDQISLSSGGVQAQVSNASSQTNNTAQQSNGDPTNDLVQANIASYDFKANLKSIQVQNDVLESLLNIKA